MLMMAAQWRHRAAYCPQAHAKAFLPIKDGLMDGEKALQLFCQTLEGLQSGLSQTP